MGSSRDGEIVAASEATKSVLALRLILRDIGKEVKGPTVLFEDNQAAIYFAQNEATPPRMKHIDLREHFVRDYVQSGDVRLAKIASAATVRIYSQNRCRRRDTASIKISW